MKEYLLGKVVDIKDPKKLGRIRVEVIGRTEGIKREVLPWYVPLWRKDLFDLPKLDEIVYVTLHENDIHLGFWKLRQTDDRFELSDTDYESAKIILKRYLKDWEEEGDFKAGLLEISYTKTAGLMIRLKESKINIRRNGTIHLYSEALKKQIDIVGDQISFGKLNRSDQPCVMGNNNNTEHTKQADYTKWLATTISTYSKQLATTAAANPFTAPLAPILTKFFTEIDLKSPIKHMDIITYLPELLSELCSLDKKVKD